MSTQQEKLTPISKTGDDFSNSFVKSEDAAFGSTNSSNFCEKSTDKQNIVGKFCLPLVEAKVTQLQSKFETFGDLNGVRTSSAAREELEEKTDDREETADDKLATALKPIVSEQDSDRPGRNFENLNTKKAKKRFSEFLKSLCVLCDICDDRSTERVIKLNRHERIVAAIILKKTLGFGVKTKKIFPTKIPEQSCGRCFGKIILLHNRHKNKFAQRKIKREGDQVMDPTSHGYHCQCLTCQNQYGDLPVLLKGIEEQNRMQTGQLQVNFQPEHNLDIPHSHTLVNLQPPVNIVAGQNQEQAHFQQYSTKYEEQYFQEQYQGPLQLSQTSTHSYSHFQMSESQTEVNFHTTSKTELYLGQTPGDFSAQRLTVGGPSHFDVKLQGQSQYYDSKPSCSSTQSLAESDSGSQEQHLPTLLQELEEKCQTDLTSQPSTSSGFSGQSHSPDDKQSKKIMTCEHCHKNFTHKGDFNKHLRKHTKEKPYKCSFCDKMFSHTSNLHRHERIHSGDRPFRCQHCDKCFNRTDKLESHKNSKFCKNRRNWK